MLSFDGSFDNAQIGEATNPFVKSFALYVPDDNFALSQPLNLV